MFDEHIEENKKALETKNRERETKGYPMLALKLSAIFLGVLARVFFPWVRKLRDGKVVHSSKRYLYSAIGSANYGNE